MKLKQKLKPDHMSGWLVIIKQEMYLFCSEKPDHIQNFDAKSCCEDKLPMECKHKCLHIMAMFNKRLYA